MTTFRLDGRAALVTGASRGIGLAVAHALGRAGARVVINAREADRLEEATAALRAEGVEAWASPFDVTDPEAVTAGVATAETLAGPLAILVNNAGVQHRAPLQEFTDADWRRVLSTNLDSAFFVGRAVARGMIARALPGAILNVCSVQSELGRPSIAPYAASKGGLKMLTKGMAIDWGPYGIRVNGLGPGYFRTDLNAALVADPTFSGWLERRTPLGRWGEVDELAGAAVFLVSDAASFVTGQILYVDGGVTSAL